MNLLDLYNAFQKSEITQEELAKALDIDEVSLQRRMARWGLKLPLLLATLDGIRQGRVTRDEAAEALGVLPREVNQLMKRWNVVRPIKPYLVTRTASKVKWEIRKKLAIDYISGLMEIEEAADSADVSERQMRRWVSDLLQKHFDMQWKDLKTLSLDRRKRLAEEIETAERLELEKQQRLALVIKGKKSLEDEALDRVIEEKLTS